MIAGHVTAYREAVISLRDERGIDIAAFKSIPMFRTHEYQRAPPSRIMPAAR